MAKKGSLRAKAHKAFKFAPPLPMPTEQQAPVADDKKKSPEAFAGRLYPYAGMMRHTDASYAIKGQFRKGGE